MVADALIAARVPIGVKARFRQLARAQDLSESALLRRLVSIAHGHLASVVPDAIESPTKPVARLTIRLSVADVALLKERAVQRSLAPATYVSVLVRAHLRSMPPVPKPELQALKRSVAELGALGRNINQIARATHTNADRKRPAPEDLRSMLAICEGLRDHVKALLSANLRSWRTGHDTATQ